MDKADASVTISICGDDVEMNLDVPGEWVPAMADVLEEIAASLRNDDLPGTPVFAS